MNAEAKPVKRSVALVLRDPERTGRVLAVLRPPDDEDLPDVWGLPAASLREEESWEDAVRRAGRSKLGVEVRVEALLNEGERERDAHTLRMRLFEGRITDGEPRLGRPGPGETRYVEWGWKPPAALGPAARRGSLCSRLFLEVEDGRRSTP